MFVKEIDVNPPKEIDGNLLKGKESSLHRRDRRKSRSKENSLISYKENEGYLLRGNRRLCPSRTHKFKFSRGNKVISDKETEVNL